MYNNKTIANKFNTFFANISPDLFKQLYNFFQEKKLLYNVQYGFRTKHSTELAALELIDRVIVEMDKKVYH